MPRGPQDRLQNVTSACITNGRHSLTAGPRGRGCWPTSPWKRVESVGRKAEEVHSGTALRPVKPLLTAGVGAGHLGATAPAHRHRATRRVAGRQWPAGAPRLPGAGGGYRGVRGRNWNLRVAMDKGGGCQRDLSVSYTVRRLHTAAFPHTRAHTHSHLALLAEGAWKQVYAGSSEHPAPRPWRL